MTPTPTLLLVEDDLDVREAVAEVLEVAGYPVAVASNGLEALDYLHGLPPKPCIVLLDLMMPVMDGWQFLEVLKGEHIDAPVIVLSAAPQPRLPTNVTVLSKPFDHSSLLDAVSRAVQHLREGVRASSPGLAAKTIPLP